MADNKPQVLDRAVGGRIAPKKRPMPKQRAQPATAAADAAASPSSTLADSDLNSGSQSPQQQTKQSQQPQGTATTPDVSMTGRLAAAQEKLAATEARIAELTATKAQAAAAEDFDTASSCQREIKEHEDSAGRLRIAIKKLERGARLEQKIAAQRGAGGGSPSAYASPAGSFRTLDDSPVESQQRGSQDGVPQGVGQSAPPESGSPAEASPVLSRTNAGASAQEKNRRAMEYKRRLSALELAKREASTNEDFAAAHQAKQAIIALQQEFKDVVGRGSGVAALGGLLTREQVLQARLEEYVRKRDLLESRKRELSLAEDFQGAADMKMRVEVLGREYSDVVHMAPPVSGAGVKAAPTQLPTSTPTVLQLQPAAKQPFISALAAKQPFITASATAAAPSTSSPTVTSGALNPTASVAAANASAAAPAVRVKLTQAEVDMLPPEVRRDYELGLGRFAANASVGTSSSTGASTSLPGQKQKVSQAELASLPPEVRRDYELGLGRFAPTASSAGKQLQPSTPSTSTPASAPTDRTAPLDRARAPGGSAIQDARLYMAARGGHFSVVTQLVEQEKIPVDSVHFETGNTALFGAIEKDSPEIVLWLLEHGASVSHKNRRGEIALHTAVEKRRDPIAVMLLEHGADVLASDNLGRTPYLLAAASPLFQDDVLKPFMKKQMVQKEEAERARAAAPREEKVTMFVRGGKQQEFTVSQRVVFSDVLRQFAEHKNLLDLLADLEVVQTVMGKDSVLPINDGVLSARDKWPNTNPAYCKFTIRLKRGTDMNKQVKFREAV